MAGLSSTANLARIARIVALLLFLLPWMSVSCSTHGLDRLGDQGPLSAPTANIRLAGASGLQLATGAVSYTDSGALSSAMDEVSRLFDKPNPAVAGAALLILLSFGASFVVAGARGAIVGIVFDALAAAALCFAVLVEIPNKANALFARLAGDRAGIEIHVQVEIGFWLCLAALAAAILTGALALKAKAAPPPTAPTGA